MSVLFVAMLSAMSYSFARAALTSVRIQEVKSEAQECAVMALDILSRELRGAGFNASGRGVIPAVRVAARNQIEVVADLNGDGDTADSNERIAYSYDQGKQQLTRASGGGRPQPLVDHVASDGFVLSYFDRKGLQISTGLSDLSDDARRQIHRIDVTLEVELVNPDPNAATGIRSVISTSVCLRNQ